MKTKKKTKFTLTEFKRLRFFGISALIAVIAVVIVAAVSAQIGTVNKSPEQEKRKSVADKVDKNSKSVTQEAAQIDGQTGQVRPLTAQEARELADGIKELVNQSDEGLVQVQHQDGSVSVDLQGRFQNITVAKKNPDGTVAQSCIDNTKSAASFFGIDPKVFGDKTKGGSKNIETEKDSNGVEIK